MFRELFSQEGQVRLRDRGMPGCLQPRSTVLRASSLSCRWTLRLGMRLGMHHIFKKLRRLLQDEV